MDTPAARPPPQHASRVTTWLVLLVILPAQLTGPRLTVRRVEALGTDTRELYDLLLHGQGEAALQLVVAAAEATGGWTAAPGDVAVFDPYLRRDLRGVSLDYDEAPNCADLHIASDEQACLALFLRLEREVRFGPSLFVTRTTGGGLVIRPVFDDLLATYIEEVGHSWQEYQYETRSRQGGTRVSTTTLAEAERWRFGREYQVKRYILSLDGGVITLSDGQRETLRAHICQSYASPVDHDMPIYGAPEGWPNPQGWPTDAPTTGELVAFCAGQ